MANKRTREELAELQALPLSTKIALTKRRIREWIREFGEDGVYVSFSGGKDSTVLLHLVREEYPNVPAVFVDTGLEYPEIREFVKGFENVVWLKPKKNFREVIETFGYPFIGKEVSESVYGARRYLRQVIEESRGGQTEVSVRVRETYRDRQIFQAILEAERRGFKSGGGSQRFRKPYRGTHD